MRQWRLSSGAGALKMVTLTAAADELVLIQRRALSGLN